jgi:UDP-glucose 4-epimerase
MSAKPSVLVTGATGYVGSLLLQRIVQQQELFAAVVALDVRPPSEAKKLPGVDYVVGDIRDDTLERALHANPVDTVVHLASIVTPAKEMTRAFAYSVDVEGTRNVLRSCVGAGVKQVIVASSGAAYGYHADNPQPLSEDDALRGNSEFAYSDHKRRVEKMLAAFRRDHPELRQLVFRVCTILGEKTDNQITDIFRRPLIIGVAETEIPFVFVWDQDLVSCIVKGILECADGVYNVAGDGQLTLRQIARSLGKPYLPIPPSLLRGALWLLHKAGISQYGPEQVNFLRYRPVLANNRLKGRFGYTPRYSSSEAFDNFVAMNLRP